MFQSKSLHVSSLLLHVAKQSSSTRKAEIKILRKTGEEILIIQKIEIIQSPDGHHQTRQNRHRYLSCLQPACRSIQSPLFCIAVFNSSPGWKLIFTQLMSVAFRSSFLSLPLLLRDGENVPQLPSFTLCPSDIRRCNIFRN